MSDTSEDTSERPNDKDDNVCRDFVRGICDRKFCKYKHENEIRPLNFCHDFQNNVCPRLNCKFIHCSPDEVEEYKRTGEMSNQILAEATRKNQLPGTPPVCNQFKKGLCRRTNCKFRHLTKEQEEQEIFELIQNNVQRKQGSVCVPEPNINVIGSLNGFSALGVLRRNGVNYDEYQDSGLPLAKRRFVAAEEMLNRELQLEADRTRAIFKGYFAGSPPPGVLSRVDSRTILLEEENNILHKEIAQLKKQVQDLTATNEFLLDQNATLRVTNKQNSVNMPAVTLTNTNSQPQVIRTVTASVATVPVSLATVTTGNPVSGNPVSIAGCPTVSIASPAQILAPSQQILVTTNPGQQLALATSTQQLTSQAQHMANQQLALANASQQLTTQSQQLALASNPQTHQQLNQQLSSQAQQLANQQLTSQAQQLANQQLTSQAQQLANQQLTSQAQQLALANTTQQLTSQAQQLALANTTQQLTSQAQQLALANAPQQLTSQAQQLALANTTQQLTVTNHQQQLALANTSQQLLAAQQNLAASTQQMELHRTNQITAAINTSQAIAMSHATQPMMSYPIMTQSLNHPLAH